MPENDQNISNPVENQSQLQPQPIHRFQRWEKIAACVVVLIVCIYILSAQYFKTWPFTVNLMPALTTPTPHPSPEASEGTATAGWQTYRNEEYGFEFKYPGDWEKLEEKNNIFYLGLSTKEKDRGIYPINSLGIQVSLEDFNSLEEWIESFRKDVTILKKERVMFKNYDGLAISELETIGGCSGEYIIILVNKKIFQFPDSTCEKDTLIDQILSTFKFNEPIPADWISWRAYDNNIIIRIPPDWEIKQSEDSREISIYTSKENKQMDYSVIEIDLPSLNVRYAEQPEPLRQTLLKVVNGIIKNPTDLDQLNKANIISN